MKLSKRILCMLLVLCLTLSMAPGAAYASGSTIPFTDVKESDWFYESVVYVYEKGLMQGTAATIFSPNQATTRGMIVTILHRLEGKPEAGSAAFEDVAPGRYYSQAVAWASENGIVSGYGNGKFGPNDLITREQLAAILFRYVRFKGYDDTPRGDLSQYQDSALIHAYAQEAMSWAVGSGLICGVSDTMIAPGGSAIRAQSAAILTRICHNVLPPVRTVRFEYNYDNLGTYSTAAVLDGTPVDAPADPVRDGYDFSGWYTAPEGGEVYDFTAPVTEDFSLYAHWTQQESSGITFELYASESDILIGGGTRLCLYLNTDADVEAIELYEISADAQTFLGYMYDDGLVNSSGDDMKGDGTYSLILEQIPQEDREMVFQAQAEDLTSNTVSVLFYQELPDEILDNLEQADNLIEDLVDTFDDLTLEERKEAALELINTMEQEELIITDSVSYNEEAYLYSFLYEGGILGGIQIENYDAEFNGGRSPGEYQPFSETNPSEEGTDVQIPAGTAIILNSFPSFEWKAEDIAFRTDFYEDLQDAWNEANLETTLDTEVTISDYLNLYDYDVICISTHGSVYSWRDGFLWTEYHEFPAICLSEKSSWSKNKTYSAELKSKQIAKVNGKYWILPAFFENAYGSDGLDGKFVFSECCMFMGRNGKVDTSMADALVNCGAEAVVGFHNSVYAVYSRELMASYVNALINGKTTGEAFAEAKAAWGNDHKIWYESVYGTGSYDNTEPVAYPILTGDDTARLIQQGLRNGDFELYSSAASAPTHWSAEGDVRSLSVLGDLAPQGDGSKRMAILTTGVGSKSTASFENGTEGSRIYQKFVVTEGVTTLTFDYNFVSEEPMEYVGSMYNDSFGIRLMQNGEVALEIIYESINDSQWTPVENIDFAGGDETVYHTGWKTVSLDVSAYQGQVITLCFIIYDVGDSLYDSAVLLDNVVLS